MRKRPEKSPHRIRQEEVPALAERRLDSFEKGDVFVREGAPCMRLDRGVDEPPIPPKPPIIGAVPIVNLQTGSAWNEDPGKMVHPAINVVLQYGTHRISN